MRIFCALVMAVYFFTVPATSQQTPTQAKPVSKRPVATSQKALALAALAAIDRFEMDANRWPHPKDHQSATAARTAINKVTDFELRKGLELLMMDIQSLMVDAAMVGLDPNNSKDRKNLDADTAEYKRDHLFLMNKLS